MTNLVKRIVSATIIKMVVFIGLLNFLPEGYIYKGDIPTLGIAAFMLAVIFSIIMPLVRKMTFLVNILTLGGLGAIIRIISMGLVFIVLNFIGFSAVGVGYWLLVLLIFTIV